MIFWACPERRDGRQVKTSPRVFEDLGRLLTGGEPVPFMPCDEELTLALWREKDFRLDFRLLELKTVLGD